MKRITAIALFAIATLGASTSILAQDRVLKVDVPFDFSVGNQTLPAARYTVRSPMAGIVLFQSVDHRFAAMTTTQHGEGETNGASKIVFDKYGDRYFLHRIVCRSSASINVNVPISKLEKRVRSEHSRTSGNEIALLGTY